MTKKIFFLILLSFILLSSCIAVTNSPKPSPSSDINKSSDKNENNLPIPSRSPEGQVEMLTPPPPDYSKSVEVNNNVTDEVTNQEKLDFDTQQPEMINNSNGDITVIYKNEYKMRVDRENHKIISRVDKEAEEAINNILNKYKILGYSDLSSSEQTEEEMDKMQSDVQNKTNVDIPHLMSIHYYKFSKDTDILSLLRELKKTGYVRDAYSTHMLVISF